MNMPATLDDAKIIAYLTSHEPEILTSADIYAVAWPVRIADLTWDYTEFSGGNQYLAERFAARLDGSRTYIREQGTWRRVHPQQEAASDDH